MEELTIEEWMEKSPYLKKWSENTLFIYKKEFEELKNSEKININSEDVLVEFLRRIIKNNSYYQYALKYLKGETNRFAVSFIIGGDTGGTISYNRSTIIKGIEELILSGKLVLNQEERDKFEILKDCISFEKFLSNNKGKKYDIEIEGNNYSIPINLLIELFQLPNDQFDNLISNNEIKKIFGIPKEHFIYAAMKFLVKSKIKNNYLIPDSIVNRYNEIASFQKIDIESINKYLTITDTKYKGVHIDDDLEKAIVSGMPSDVSDLEKAIYIYIKMCKLLTYDEEYYAVNQKGEATRKHRNSDYVSSINLKNNKVVCFEFNLIYSKLLNDLGIKFKTDYHSMFLDDNGESYGDGHANLVFRSNKYLVLADSVTSILQGDIMRAKLNEPLVGIKCINKNMQTQKEFNEALMKMYKVIAEQDKSITNIEVGHLETLDELLGEYAHVTENIHEISLNERLSILIKKVNSTKMIGIDSLSYVLQLRKILFNEVQRKNNINVSIVRNNEPFDEEKVAMASVIFTLNDRSFTERPDRNVYYYYNPHQELVYITKEELQAKFDDGILEYIEKEDPRIPEIMERGGVKK